MSEWKRVKLGDLLEEYCEKNIDQQYKVVAVGKYGIRRREDIYTKELSKDISKNKIIMKDTLTIGMGSNQIDIGILIDDCKFCVSPAYTTYKIKNCNSEFLKYYMEYLNPKLSDLFMIVSARQGKSVDKDGLLKYEVMLPPIGEQEKIVEILKTIDSIIEKHERLLEEKNQFIKSLFVEMFERGHYPKDEFINIAKEIYAGGDKPKDISKVKEGEYLYPVFANGYENEGLQGYSKVYRTGDSAVTISARGTIGYSFIRNEKFTPIVRLITIIPNEKANVVYLKYAIDNLNIAGSGTSQAQLTVPDIKKNKIIIPPIELQNKFADFVKQIDKQKFLLEKQKQNYENLRKGLMRVKI